MLQILKKLNAKKLCLILALILSPTICFAADSLSLNFGSDYLISTENHIKANNVDNPSILTLSPFFTIFNEKNILLVHPKKVGKTKLTLFLDTQDVTFDIVVKPENTPSKFIPVNKNGVEFILLDHPPQPPVIENFTIDTPPVRLEEAR